MKSKLAFSILLSAMSCSLFEDNGTEVIEAPASVESVLVESVSATNIGFLAICTVPTPCWTFSRYQEVRRLSDISIKVYRKTTRDIVCPQVVWSIRVPLKVEVPSYGTYSFHFWQSDTTAFDTTITIQGPIVNQPDSIIMTDPFNFDRRDWPDGNYYVREASIVNDILKVRVELVQATENDPDLVCWNYWLESEPVQAHVLLAYEEQNGAKEVVSERELLFDLVPMKEAYQRSYRGWGAGNVIILGFRDPHHPQPTDAWVRYAVRP